MNFNINFGEKGNDMLKTIAANRPLQWLIALIVIALFLSFGVPNIITAIANMMQVSKG